MTTTVVSAFGTFTEEELKKLKKGLSELSDVMTMKQAQSDAMKEIISSLHEELNIPKKMIRKMGVVYYKSNYNEVVAEQEEFEALFSGIIGNQQNS